MSAPPRADGAQPTGSLAAGRLGVPAVLFFVMSAATPLTVVAGVVTTGFATTGLTGIPVAFVVIGLVLAVFSVGYVAMARNLANAGAFYTFVARGVGRPAGIGASWVALVAYNALQVGLYGAIGAAAGPLLNEWFGFNREWWVIALVCWAVVAVLGVLRIDVNGIVLAVLLCAEVLIILVYSFADLGSPAGGAISTATLDPSNLFGDGVGAILVLALLGFVGFEASVVFSEEAKDPKRTVRTATYIAVGATAVLYTFASWAMTVATGPDTIVERSQQESVGLIFGLAGANLGDTWVTIGEVLFATSVAAAMISFHNMIARYMFALGRERVLPAALGRTSASTHAPRNASLVQSVIGLVVIIVYAIGGWEPTVHLFFWAGTSGGLGVLFLITLTSLAVLLFFRRDAHGESTWSRLIAPSVALVALAVVVVLAVANFDALLGVAPDSALAWAIPAAFVVIGLAGAVYGMWLKTSQPDVYAAIGSGGAKPPAAAEPATVDAEPAPAEVPAGEAKGD
ncbi:amino acid permease [Asanoa ishikariensis]|uniref:Amino acid transporter n=1 Tax=Asanoa ishikariensis TaxID=137265 RepID=A0A1H3TPW1_9ACTN|nr:APC family permease [Asanoa ishikariensis]GIF62014.1 amino acid permease [Asanoa ishikariensis]SDZ52236.1 Amino acid transporter [Asanoa ishikariensis]